MLRRPPSTLIVTSNKLTSLFMSKCKCFSTQSLASSYSAKSKRKNYMRYFNNDGRSNINSLPYDRSCLRSCVFVEIRMVFFFKIINPLSSSTKRNSARVSHKLAKYCRCCGFDFPICCENNHNRKLKLYE